MLNKFFQIFLILVFTMSCKQDTAHFKQQVKPNKTYIIQLTNSTNSVGNFIADQETLNKIESNGLNLSIKAEIVSKMNMDVITKGKDTKGEFAAEKRYGDMSTTATINGKTGVEKKPYSGMRIMGKYDKRNRFSIDSIDGVKLSSKMRYLHNVGIEKLQIKMKFPKNKIKVGDTIHNEMPLDIPMQGIQSVRAILKNKYIFQEIKDKKAIFKLIQRVYLDTIWDQENTKIKGSGFGRSVFDLRENTMISHSYELPMELTIIVNEQLTAVVKMTMKSEQTISIE